MITLAIIISYFFIGFRFFDKFADQTIVNHYESWSFAPSAGEVYMIALGKVLIWPFLLSYYMVLRVIKVNISRSHINEKIKELKDPRNRADLGLWDK